MWGAILGILSRGLSILDKFLPSWEWKGGRAESDARHAKEARDVSEKQLEIAAKAPVDRDALLKRMFKRRRRS